MTRLNASYCSKPTTDFKAAKPRLFGHRRLIVQHIQSDQGGVVMFERDDRSRIRRHRHRRAPPDFTRSDMARTGYCCRLVLQACKARIMCFSTELCDSPMTAAISPYLRP